MDNIDKHIKDYKKATARRVYFDDYWKKYCKIKDVVEENGEIKFLYSKMIRFRVFETTPTSYVSEAYFKEYLRPAFPKSK
jgi:hypothetical protein